MKTTILFAGLAASLSVAAQTESWRYRSADIDAREVADSGVLARTEFGFLQASRDRVLRRDPTGQLLSESRSDPPWTASGGPLLPLADGSWLSLRTPQTSACAVQKFDAQARRLWISELASQNASCDAVELFSDARGGWLLTAPGADDRGRRLIRLREDGELVGLDLAAAGLASIEVLRQRADGSFDLALIDAQGLQMARLVDGRVAEVTRIASFSTVHSRRVVSARGDVWITARGIEGHAGDSLLAFDANGQRLLRVPLELAANVHVQGLAMVRDDAVGILTRDVDATVWELRTVDLRGIELARLRPSGSPVGFADEPALRPFAAPGVVALKDGWGVRESGYDAFGNIVPTPIELGGRGETAQWPRTEVTYSGYRSLVAWDATADSTDVLVGASGAIVRSIDAEGRGDELSFLRPESFARPYPIRMLSAAARLCVGPISHQQIFEFVSSQAICIDRATGQQIYDASGSIEGIGPTLNLGPLSELAMDAQQRVLSLVAPHDSASPELKLLRIETDGRSGALRKLADLPAPPRRQEPRDWGASLDALGNAVFAQPHPQGGLFLMQARGEDAPLVVRLATDAVVQVQAVLDRGARGVALSVAVSEGSRQRDELWLVDAAGSLTHRIELGDRPLFAQTRALLREVDGELLIAHATRPISELGSARARQTIGRVSANGSWRWQRSDQRVAGDSLVDLQLAGSRGLVLSERAGQPRLEQFELLSGQSLDVRSLRCPNSLSCRPRGLVVDPDNHARLIAEVDDVELGLQVDVVKFALAEPARPRVEALTGLWYAPESTGQGLVLGMMPGAGAMLGGWFTHAAGGVNRNSDQRWYALDARYAAGATALNIEIRRASDAAFDVDGAATVQPTGNAEVYLRGCNEAVFRYTFDEGDEAGLAGEIPLLRLGPGAGDCAQPGSQRADGGGFSLRQSGAWYDPAQSGQGVIMEVLPPAPGEAGLLSAGWFTFDPQGAADDPDAQHWFLVQGEIASTAAGGEVEVPIFNAIGGSLDAGRTRNVREVGRARMQMLGCDLAHMDYRFGPDAGAYAGRSGRIELRRVSGCEAR
jgi:hypothetical protein